MNIDDCTNDVFVHKETGKHYKILGFAFIESTQEHAVVYKDIQSSLIWVRPTLEFFDGRFVFFGKQ